MNFLRRLFPWLFTAAERQRNAYQLRVKCSRCDEIIETRLNLNNDLSVDYQNGQARYFCRKVLVGSGPCFQPIEVHLVFNQQRQIIDRQIEGGSFVEGE